MSEVTTSRVCDHCGAPLRGLVDGYCPYCRTRPFAPGGAGVADGVVAGSPLHSVVLLDAGRKKIAVIKELREIVEREFRVELGLKEAKALADRANRTAPPALIVDVEPARAQMWAAAFAGVGATVEIRPPLGSLPPPATAPPAASPAATRFGVHLLVVGRKKINVVKVVREVTGAGLAEAKDVVDAADRMPQLVIAGLDQQTATSYAQRLADAGATCEVRPD
jgi:large subunit ribosomal protein L7/L12